MPKQDKAVLLLIDKVSEKKEQIESAQNPQWETNCNLKIDGENVNLRTVQTVEQLVNIAANVKVLQLGYEAAIEELGGDTEFKYSGYTTEQWMADIKTRLSKLNIDKEKKNLSKLEQRLDKIISPELRAEMELAAIQKELDG